MQSDKAIGSAQRRIMEVFKKRPGMALSTEKASGRLEDGLKVTFSEGGRLAVMDMERTMGGTEAGPSPGFYARAGIVGCVAIGIKMAAAREGLTLDSIDIGIETDFDDSAIFGLGEASAAPTATRLSVTIESSETPAAVEALVQQVLKADPWYLALKEAQEVSVETKVAPSAD